MAMATATTDELIGSHLKGRYRVISLLDGSGGMADVYLGEDMHVVGRQVVIKLPRMAEVESSRHKRFLQEVRLLVGVGELHAKHIVPVYDADTSGDRPFLVMPFMPGGNLIRWARVHPPVRDNPELHVRQWMNGIAAALDTLHGQGIVHRDVKAANILFDAQGVAVLADFGITKALASSQHFVGGDVTQFGTAPGTPGYIAPEILGGMPATAKSDQYALAVTIYSLMNPDGGLPVKPSGEPNRFMRPIMPLSQVDTRVPPAASRAVLRALAVDPAKRFGSCREFVATFDRAWSARGRRPRIAAAGAVGLVRRGRLGAFLEALGRGIARLPGRAPPVDAEHRIRRLTVDAAVTLVSRAAPLRLHAIARVSPDVAGILAGHSGGVLSLGGLRRLDREIAEVLARHTGQLLLDGVRELDADAAEALAGHRGGLSLNGIETIDIRSAGMLALHRGRLSLGGLRRLDTDVARALAQHGHELHLDGIPRLVPESAAILARHAGPLGLGGLGELDAVVAKQLAEHRHTLWLCGIRELDDDAATALAAHRGLLFLPRLRGLGRGGRAALEANPDVRLGRR